MRNKLEILKKTLSAADARCNEAVEAHAEALEFLNKAEKYLQITTEAYSKACKVYYQAHEAYREYCKRFEEKTNE